MSSLESPTTSSTEPTSRPSESTTVQPDSIMNQETGSPCCVMSHRATADKPDRPLCSDRVCIRECVQDLDLAGDALLVAALEAAGCHLRRGSVAEVVRAAEPEGRHSAVARWVHRREQQRRALEVVGRV